MEAAPDGAVALEVLRQMVTTGSLLWRGRPATTWVSLETDWIDVGPAGAELLQRLSAASAGQ